MARSARALLGSHARGVRGIGRIEAAGQAVLFGLRTRSR